MGNCCAKEPSTPAKNDLRRGRTRRQNTWESTGVVSLRDAGVRELPPAVEAIAGSVRVIDATNNRIAALPPYLSAFVSLQRLVLSRNVLTSLPADIGTLASLKVLLLDGNQIGVVPESIGRLKRLERLSLAGNSLTALPVSLGSLTSLVQLDVSKNKLMQLPEELGGCAALDELNAEDNYLQTIPASLSSLKNLKSLNLDGNRVRAIPPPVLADCAALHTLSLHGNPITIQDVQATEGWAAFEARRKSKFDKSIGAGVLLDSKGLDEGVDMQRRRG